EKPLLLHPCKDKPLEFFSYPLEAGDPQDAKSDRRGLVCARPAVANGSENRAEASINVYGLNRGDLVLARKKRFIEIMLQIGRVKKAAARVQAAPDAAVRAAEQADYDNELAVLLNFKNEKEPYSLMAAQIIAQFVPKA